LFFICPSWGIIKGKITKSGDKMLVVDMVKSLFKPKYTFDIYFGVPGSGKTTFAAWIAKRCIKNKIPVW
jgi:replication-associated recombination protein RarA